MTARSRVLAVPLLLVMALLAGACSLDRPGGGRSLEAVVTRSNNLFVGSDVRVLGMRVGRVSAVEPAGTNVRVTMSLDPGVEVPADVAAEIQPTSLLGERFVALHPAYTGGPTWPEGEPIPLERTGVPAETDEVLASFEQWLEGMNPETLAELVDVLADTLEGQGQGLNGLLQEGGDTIRVLADSSDDLMAAVSALADVSQTMAARDQRISAAIENWSTVVGTLGEESDQVVAGVANIRRLVGELKPLLDEHAVPLSSDIKHLTTALQTVDRNLARIGLMASGSAGLFDAAGTAFEHEHGRLKLLNIGNELPQHIADRFADRLVGVCARLAEAVCATRAFWDAHLPAALCWEGVTSCAEGRKSLAAAFGEAMGALPPETQERLAEDAREREAQPEPEPGEEPDALGLPLPDGRLDLNSGGERIGLLERFARLLGGGRR